MDKLLENRERVEEVLLGVELTCFFAFVGLSCYAAGWVQGQLPVSTGSTDPLIDPGVNMATFAALPTWVGTGLYVTVVALLVAVAIDVFLVFEDDEIDVREWFDERLPDSEVQNERV